MIQRESLILSPYLSLYDMIIPKEHELRQLNELVDFSFVDEMLCDTYTLDNGTKNYQICNVKVDVTDASDATSEKLYYDTFNSKNRVNIPTGQSLFILSLITQSGAGIPMRLYSKPKSHSRKPSHSFSGSFEH